MSKAINIDELTIGQARELSQLFAGNKSVNEEGFDNGLIGRYVIVRCRDAGVHAGVLESHHNRECILSDSRRLWQWFPAKGKWLSAVANYGVSNKSKISETVDRIHLTEDCEIILCTSTAEASLRAIEVNE